MNYYRMHLVQLFLPLYDNQKQPFPPERYEQVRRELLERFGGLTAYLRSPARGLWKEDDEKTIQDDIVIYEVMAEELDREWWKRYREELRLLFSQESLVVRVTGIEML